MNKQKPINQLIDETMTSLDQVMRASPAPYLLTRVQQRLNQSNETIWEKAGWLIGRPSIAIPGLFLLIILNVTAIVFNNSGSYAAAAEQATAAGNDEFSFSVATIYEIENTEP